ncbi:YALI0D21186p [Yarrowia lipolytica CLIB122]|uniref:YALI0D21186p n=1 Tax=Yarrowia lipolytica (strain CLIB 122 / E 150) TaxID=284591 RepID=Q6C8A9_YARLI|nr:YALI0D21186p [Yarrowia lipolytica CLIB122]CAG81295.1 YALI0D21186p [Yarrowia lipolytica CLIB122]|eukprot:XP_503103.1 YALI0D21186p [Yarrowia lipolytica CLIB122]
MDTPANTSDPRDTRDSKNTSHYERSRSDHRSDKHDTDDRRSTHRESSSRHSSSRSHRRHRSERSDRPERSERSERSDRHRSSRSSRSSRSNRDRSRSRESRRSDRRRHRDRSSDGDLRREQSHGSRSHEPRPGKWVIDESDEEDEIGGHVADTKGSVVLTRSDEINSLNKQIADDLRAKLQGKTPSTSKKEEDDSAEEDDDTEPGKKPEPVVLSAMDTQMMGPAVPPKPEDMTIAEMVAEERRLSHMGNASSRAAETISRDKGFSVDNDYADDNSSRLASLVSKKQIDLKNMAISQVQKMTKILDTCDLCAEDRAPNTSVISTGTRVHLSIAPKPELAAYSAVIVPIAHHKNTLECDSDEWEEIRNFQKCLAVMYMSMGLGVCFYENAARPWLFPHAHIVCIPVPLDLTNDISPFFQEAFLTSDTEWSQHRKVIQTGGKGKLGFQTSIAKEAPYVHVWLTIDGGVGHIVEDANKWPKDDRFAREVISGLLRCPVELAKRTVTWGEDKEMRAKFVTKWDKYDWTKQLE